MSNINYQRLSLLGDKVKAGIATKPETDEFMSMLYQGGKISEQQYQQYINSKSKQAADEIVNAALAIGAVLLIGYLLKELFSGK